MHQYRQNVLIIKACNDLFKDLRNTHSCCCIHLEQPFPLNVPSNYMASKLAFSIETGYIKIKFNAKDNALRKQLQRATYDISQLNYVHLYDIFVINTRP